MAGLLKGLFNGGQLEPIAEPGQNILMSFGRQWLLYQVIYIEALWHSQALTVDLTNGAGLAALSTAGPFSTQNQIDQNDGEMAQMRMSIMDDFQVTFRQPLATVRGVDRNSTSLFDPFSQLRDEDAHMTEFFVSQQNRPYLNATNITNFTIPFARVAFEGIRYVLSGGDGTTQGASGAIQSPIQSFPNGLGQAQEWGKANNTKFVVVPVQGWAGG